MTVTSPYENHIGQSQPPPEFLKLLRLFVKMRSMHDGFSIFL